MASLLEAKALAVQTYLTGELRAELTKLPIFAPRRNVTAMGVGRKYVNGRPTGAQAVRIYVERKLPEAQLPSQLILPKEIMGIPTDVIETGRFQLCTAPSGPLSGSFRPVQPGCSCSYQLPPPNQNVLTASTIGAIVQANGKTFILSNNHALANANSLPPGTPIFQPGLLDGPNLATGQIAALTNFIPIASVVHNVVDCAIAELLDGTPFNGEILPQIGRLSTATPTAAVEGMTVEKVGRTTRHTVGSVVDVNATVPVLYPNPVGIATFDGQIFVQDMDVPFSAGGDSGALVVDQTSKAGTGLLFAKSSGGFTACNPLGSVLAALGVTLVI